MDRCLCCVVLCCAMLCYVMLVWDGVEEEEDEERGIHRAEYATTKTE